MDLFADIAAVQSRIAEIAGPPPAPPESVAPALRAGGARFANALSAAMNGSPGLSGSPTPNGGPPSTPAPAPVAPAQLDALVQQNASTWQVDPALVKAVIANESGFNANATSPVGAQGLMQLMPDTAASLGVRDAYDPGQNVAGGTRYLRGLLDRFGGNMRLAIAAYNAGPGAVEKYGDVPPYSETQNYVQNVMRTYQETLAAEHRTGAASNDMGVR